MGIAVDDRVHVTLGLAARTGSVETSDLERAKAQLAALEHRRAEIVKNAKADTAVLQAKLPPSLVQVARLLSSAKQFRDAVQEYDNGAPCLSLKPGARLVREWRGRTHTVTVTEDGFAYGGASYPSLTKIAKLACAAPAR